MDGKQTYRELSTRYGLSKKTIQKRLDAITVEQPIIDPRATVVVMDTIYFGRTFGVMVFRDVERKKNIYWRIVRHETIKDYMDGIQYLQKCGWDITAIVCDGKRGIFKAFGNIPIQMCQFHQVAIITRYLTKKPRLEASKELKNISQLLTQTDKESFIGLLNDWHHKWENFLKEKTIREPIKKWNYTHKRLRSAYRSLKTNLPFLWTWYDNPELKIPNTTNSLEGIFSSLKTKLRVHAGLKIQRKIKAINQVLSAN